MTNDDCYSKKQTNFKHNVAAIGTLPKSNLQLSKNDVYSCFKV